MKLLKSTTALSLMLIGVLGFVGPAANAAVQSAADTPVITGHFMPDTKVVDGYTVSYCGINQNEGALDFCSKRAVSAYKRLGTSKNINFNKKYVLIGFKGIREGAKNMQYAAVDPATKKVYPFDFIVYSDNYDNYEKVKISIKTSTLCADEVAIFSGDRMLKTYGGYGRPRGESLVCFSFDEKSGFDSSPSS